MHCSINHFCKAVSLIINLQKQGRDKLWVLTNVVVVINQTQPCEIELGQMMSPKVPTLISRSAEIFVTKEEEEEG